MRSKLILLVTFLVVCFALSASLQASPSPIAINNTGVAGGLHAADLNWNVTLLPSGLAQPAGSSAPVLGASASILPNGNWPAGGPWVAAPIGSSWITPDATDNHQGGLYRFTTTFTAPTGSYSGIVISGSWATDNIGGVVTNWSGTSANNTSWSAGSGISVSKNSPAGTWVGTGGSGDPAGYNGGTGVYSYPTGEYFYSGANSTIPGVPSGTGFVSPAPYNFSFFVPSSELSIGGTNYLNFYIFNYPQASGNPAGLLVTNLSAQTPEPMAVLLFGTVGFALLLSRRLRRRA